MVLVVETGVQLWQAYSLTAVADALAEDLARPRADPFTSDLVLVSGPGPQRWLAQRLSQVLGAQAGDGVCAGIDFTSVPRFAHETELAVLQIDPDADPWREDRLTWSLLAAFDACHDRPWFRAVATFLDHRAEQRPGRRLTLARSLARRFRSYARWRPDLLTTVVDEFDAWQPRLWQAVTQIVDAEPPWLRRRRAIQALIRDPALSTAPPALYAVAPGRLSPAETDILTALGHHRHVVVATVQSSTEEGEPHPLLASLGQAERAATTQLRALGPVRQFPAPTQPPTTMLATLQHGIRSGQVSASPLPVDDSIQVHTSHGLDRQVEVLRDLLVDLLQQDPSLEPREIVVVTPDLARVAPLVRACCGLDHDRAGVPVHPAGEIRVQVADRSLRQENPVLQVLERVLALTTSRAGVSELLALCAMAPVARRFGFDEEALQTLAELTESAGIRWGIDSRTRRRFGMEQFGQNTWLAGLQRLLLGVTLNETDLAVAGSVLPLGTVESSDVDVIGSLAELISLVRHSVLDFEQPTDAAGWAARFRGLLEQLVAVPPTDSWQLGHAWRLLAELEQPDSAVLSVGEVRALVADWLAGRSARPALLTGALTVTSMEALRQIPHRVVCLVGLSEARFPASSDPDGDDLLARTVLPTEPNPSWDDRQLFLDAVMAATQTLLVVFSGRDPRTNEEFPVPTPVVELLEALRSHGFDPSAVVRNHGLHPHEPQDPTPTYDQQAAAARRALARARSASPPARDRFATDHLPPIDLGPAVPLEQLIGFFRHPIQGFLTARVGSWWDISRFDPRPRPPERASEEIPVDPGGLARWATTDRLLALRLAGHDPAAAAAAEWRRGVLAPQALGREQMRLAQRDAAEIWDRARRYATSPLRHRDLQVQLGEHSLTGRVPVHDEVLLQPSASWPRGRHLIQPWLQLLLLAAAEPGPDWRALLCGRGPVVQLTAPAPQQAREILAEMVELMRAGWQQPLPLPPGTAIQITESPHTEATELDRTWRFERDPCWQVYFATLGDLDRAAQAQQTTFEGLAQRAYGPLVNAKGRP